MTHQTAIKPSTLLVLCLSAALALAADGPGKVSRIAVLHPTSAPAVDALFERQVGDFVWTGGDCHIDDNHVEQVRTQLERTPYPYPTPQITRRPPSTFDCAYEDFELPDYRHRVAIKAPVAV